MPSKHAMLSPSGAHRWMLCTPSAKWESELPDSTSEYAEEGTVAHSLCEAKLRYLLNKDHAAYIAAVEPITESKWYSAAMESYTDQYAQAVQAFLDEALLAGDDPHLYIEVQLNLEKWIPGGFGTSDAVILTSDTIHVIDFKFGKGVVVSAANNPQMRCYALGAYDEFEAIEDFSKVRMTIIQPRVDNISTEEISVSELLTWGADKLRPAAAKAYRGEGFFEPSDEACRFCRAKYLCAYNAERHLQNYTLNKQKGEPAELTPADTANILNFVDDMVKWANGLKEYAETQAVSGAVEYPGYKVVAGRSNRKIDDTAKATEKLLAAGCKTDEIFELKGLTALEKTVGMKKLAKILSGLIVKPQGKPTLVKNSDKRAAISVKPDVNDYFKD